MKYALTFLFATLIGCTTHHSQPPIVPSLEGKARLPINSQIPTKAPVTVLTNAGLNAQEEGE